MTNIQHKTQGERQERSSTSEPGLHATVASEVLKLRTLAFPKVLGLISIVLSALTAVLFLVTIEATQGDPLEALPASDVASTALLGVDATAIVLIVLGGWLVATEYASGMIHTSMVATPNRLKLYTAKLIVTAGLGMIAGLLAAVVTLLSAQLVLIAQGIPALNFLDPELLRMSFGSLLMVPFYAILAAAAAFVLRSTGGAVVVTLAVMFMPAVINMLPSAGQELLFPLLPSSALASISGLAEVGDPAHLVPLLAAVSLLVWWVVFIGFGFARFARRDA
ncbi:MAG: ABC transporter permease [Yaniella sp.]|uniref:ABC transporter permease subunit n=1 Tax=Yaniella sp. TaxID=2773929 RepID=UPI0026482A0C|nr:ABC transporter permease subunit [Yaniella sp.]MDN5817913.1 ABC transporter permease [Yaniella sp.]